MNRGIKKLVVLGSGLMGTRLAALFASLGIEVCLMDRREERGVGEPGYSPNRIAEKAWNQARRSKPSILFHPRDADRVRLGNLDDDLGCIAEADWIIEAVTERREVKKSVLDLVEKHCRPEALVTTNTSGLSIGDMAKGRSASFTSRFAGMHFFNPPRYLKLVELIPGPDTDPEVIEFLSDFAFKFLGKTPILCRDTPAFIANRMGVFAFLEAFRSIQDGALTVEELDFLTGPLVGRPKSATLRTADLVGLDTLALVAKNLQIQLEEEASLGYFDWPDFAESMVEKQWLGEKTGQGFYKKQKTDAGTEIESLRVQTLDYGPSQKPSFPEIRDMVRAPLEERLKRLYKAEGKAGAFFRNYIWALLSYASRIVPEVSDHPHAIDQALRHGFGWTLGPFEIWDILGVANLMEDMNNQGKAPAPWVKEMLDSGRSEFYQMDGQDLESYSPVSRKGVAMAEPLGWKYLDRHREQILWKNDTARIYDLGEDILLLRWDTKLNTIGSEVISAIHRALDWAESKNQGLILANNGLHFSAGADLGLVFMLAVDQEFDELDLAVRQFQQTSLRIRYSSVPVVVAPHGLTLGGGAEFCLHADQVVAAAETYMGLVELGVGLIPAGGGTKEMAKRASQRTMEGDLEINVLQEYFRRIGMAQVSGSAQEAKSWGYLRKERDRVIMHEDRRLSLARWRIREYRDLGYRPPSREEKIKVQGRVALGGMISGLHGMRRANRISVYDQHLAQKLAWVICGGDLSQPGLVSEEYMLDLERETFLSLCGERETLERLEAMIKTGKPLRN